MTHKDMNLCNNGDCVDYCSKNLNIGVASFSCGLIHRHAFRNGFSIVTVKVTHNYATMAISITLLVFHDLVDMFFLTVQYRMISCGTDHMKQFLPYSGYFCACTIDFGCFAHVQQHQWM